MSENFTEYLRHILDECAYIVATVKDVNSFEAFVADEDKKRGIVRSLEVIGEATKRVPADVKYKWKRN